MPVGVNTSGGGIAPQPPGALPTESSAHSMFVTFAGELIGVTVLAIFADMSDELGGIAVALMGGWFLLFLMTNAPELSTIVGKV